MVLFNSWEIDNLLIVPALSNVNSFDPVGRMRWDKKAISVLTSSFCSNCIFAPTSKSLIPVDDMKSSLTLSNWLKICQKFLKRRRNVRRHLPQIDLRNDCN